MLTGDDERIGKSVADELGLDAYYAQLLPDQKVEKLEMLDKAENGRAASSPLWAMASTMPPSLPVQMSA